MNAISRILFVVLIAAATVRAADADPAAEAKYTTDITNRADKIVANLEIADPAATRVRDQIVGFYRSLRDWHDANDATLKQLNKENTDESKAKAEAVKATLKPIHDKFLAALATDLNAEKVDLVKDGLTYNVLHVTYKGYTDMILRLTDEQKAFIREQLTIAREIAMDQGSSKEKHEVFGKYKGKINIYLSKAGYDMKKEEDGWRERLKAERAGQPATRPST